jgi:site-specific DNA-cytosine methylase
MSNKRIKVLSLCDGVATGLKVLKALGFAVEYHAVEICHKKRAIADLNHPEIIRKNNDVDELADSLSFEHYDLVLCGFTCTSLSSQGKREEWDGASKIFFNCVTILDGCREVNPNIKFFFENVVSMKNVCRDLISEKLGVPHFKGEAGLVSAQDRNRYYWFNWEHPRIIKRQVNILDLLDEDAIGFFSFSKSNRNKKGEPAIVEGRFKASGNAGTLVTGSGCNGRSTMNKVITNKMKIRDLRALECARIQGLPDYKWECSDEQIFEAVGDGWQADMVQEIFRQSPINKRK